MASILLGATGSVAAIRIPALFQALGGAGHDVKIVATRAATYFFDPLAIAPAGDSMAAADRKTVILDEDEWPGQRYQRDDLVPHIELRRWADLLLVAPLDANTLAKFACGMADNCLTCVWRAWNPAKPVVLAPAMNTLMWEHPLTSRHLRQLALDYRVGVDLQQSSNETLIEAINSAKRRLRIIEPGEKRLACGDTGMGAMAEVDAIVAIVNEQLSERSA